jgi:hypothetical protein
MSESISVYAEAKTEYTRQLCQILNPSLQIYFLDLLKLAKEKEQDPKRLLWNFQALLQEIPDWNQDKVLRETEKIQKESNCDYLEELLTAVFVAHTKVLSSIRITTKQKKLQITIPKIDHFLHRTLRETGRLLWGNAFLFADQGPAIERQKNMRQVEALIQEGIQQSIRSLLPVKTILREYLNDEDDDEDDTKPNQAENNDADEADIMEEKSGESVPKNEEKPGKKEETIPIPVPEEESESAPPTESVEEQNLEIKNTTVTTPVKTVVNITKEESSPTAPTAPPSTPIVQPAIDNVITAQPSSQQVSEPPTLVIATEPSVSFTNMDTIFNSDNPELNEIATSPDEEDEEIDHIQTIDGPAENVDDFEEIGSTGGIDFEEIS